MKTPQSRALEVWKQVMLAQVHADMPDLAPRQLAMLLRIYLDPPPHTVRGLAEHLRVTKPVITRGLDTMGKLGLVSRRRDEKDRRNVVISRTVDGALYVERLAELLLEAQEKSGAGK